MTWRKIADVAATVGKYEKDGQQKSKYVNCGVVLESPDGNKCIKLTCLPIKEDGMLATFLNIYPVKDKDEPKAARPAPQDDFGDTDIPF